MIEDEIRNSYKRIAEIMDADEYPSEKDKLSAIQREAENLYLRLRQESVLRKVGYIVDGALVGYRLR